MLGEKKGTGTFTRDNGLRAEVYRNTIGKVTLGEKLYLRVRMAMVLSLEKLFGNAVRFNRTDSGQDPGVRFISDIYAPFVYRGETYCVRFLMKSFTPESGRGTLLYSSRVEDIVVSKKRARLAGDAPSVASSNLPGAVSNGGGGDAYAVPPPVKMKLGALFNRVNKNSITPPGGSILTTSTHAVLRAGILRQRRESPPLTGFVPDGGQ